MGFGDITEYQASETTNCKWEDCHKTPLLYGGTTVFSDGSTYCKGECTQRAREFRANIVKGTREALRAPRKVMP